MDGKTCLKMDYRAQPGSEYYETDQPFKKRNLERRS